MCKIESKYTQWEKAAILKPCLRNIGEIFLCSQPWHQHMCTKPTRLYAWAFVWVEEEIESENVWEGKERRRDYMAFMYLGLLDSCNRTACEPFCKAYAFVGWSQLDIKHLDIEGEGLFFRELRGNVRVSPLKPCIYALLMKCDGEQSRVCLHLSVGTMGERVYVYIACMLECSYMNASASSLYW